MGTWRMTGMGDGPLASLQAVRDWGIDSVHCKHGLWPTKPDARGKEVPFGEGAVDPAAWLEKLIATGYVGPLTIEREIEGEAQTRDIPTAKNVIEAVLEQRAAREYS